MIYGRRGWPLLCENSIFLLEPRKKVSQDLFVKPKLPHLTLPPTKSNKILSGPPRDSLHTQIVPWRLTTLPFYVDGNHRKEQEVASSALSVFFPILYHTPPLPHLHDPYILNAKTFSFPSIENLCASVHLQLGFKRQTQTLTKLNLNTYWVSGLYPIQDRKLRNRCLGSFYAGFLNLSTVTWGRTLLCCGAVLCRVLTSIPGLPLLDASVIRLPAQPSLASCLVVTIKNAPDNAKCHLGNESPPVENHCYRSLKSKLQRKIRLMRFMGKNWSW